MDETEALKHAFDRTNALQTYWGFYGTAVAALLAFFGTAHRDCRIAFILSAAFAALAITNLYALRDVTRQRIVLHSI